MADEPIKEVSAPDSKNRIVVTWNERQGIKAIIWDKNSVQHDITSIFDNIKGATGTGGVWNTVIARKGNVNSSIDFRPIEKRLVFDVPQGVIGQLLQILES